MKTRSGVIGSVLATLAAFGSETANAAAGWTNGGVITDIIQQPVGSGGEVFVTASLTGNVSGCANSTSFYFALSNAHHNRLFAMLVAAHAAGRLVRVYVTGTCHAWGSAQIDGIIAIT